MDNKQYFFLYLALTAIIVRLYAPTREEAVSGMIAVLIGMALGWVVRRFVLRRR